MYEVEVMLGETDESHIVRTIEYWDREKRKWPQRQHFAVLVAESINRRFFNVIHLFSHCIPIVAVQVNIVEAESKRVLHFSKVLDTYEEPGVVIVEPDEKHDEAYWRTFSSWTLETAQSLLQVVGPLYPNASLNYLKYYIAVVADGNNCLSLRKRGSGKSLLGFRVSDTILPAAAKLLDDADLSYDHKREFLYLTVDTENRIKFGTISRNCQVSKAVLGTLIHDGPDERLETSLEWYHQA